MPYFTISHGLRGGYMPDSVDVLKCDTRRELKAAIEAEANAYKDSHYVGGSKRAIARFAAEAWREAQKPRPAYLPFCLPFAPWHNPRAYVNGVFVSVATRAEYLEARSHDDL